MTDVPEHLLRRSQERRAAVGGGGGEPPATSGEAPGIGAAASAVEPAGGSDVAPAAAPPVPVEEPPTPVPPYVEAALRRQRIPKFAIPVLAALPLWALVYAGTLAQPAESLDPELEIGQRIYAADCSSCHGAGGEGGTGRPLGGVLQTFPDKVDHINWIRNGSPAAGTPYGAEDRPGGQRIAGSDGFTIKMPAFANALSPEEIAAVARYEREVIGGGEPALSTEEDLAVAGGEAPAPGDGGANDATADAESSSTTSSGG